MASTFVWGCAAATIFFKAMDVILHQVFMQCNDVTVSEITRHMFQYDPTPCIEGVMLFVSRLAILQC